MLPRSSVKLFRTVIARLLWVASLRWDIAILRDRSALNECLEVRQYLLGPMHAAYSNVQWLIGKQT
jgi:hypothetical protein